MVFGIVIVEGVLILGNLVVGLLASTRSYLFMSNVFQILGWSSWGVKTLINNNVPFHFMYYWVLSLFTIRKLLRKHTRMRGHHFASYTGRDWAISGLLGVEIFIPIWIIFQFACAGWLGQYFSTIISFNNVILAFYVLYSLNEIVFWIYQNFLRTHPKKEILVILLYWGGFGLLLLPSLIFQKIHIWNLEFLVGLGLVASLNPKLYQKGVSLLVLTWFNYFLLIFIVGIQGTFP